MKSMDRRTNVAANNYQWTNGDYHNLAHIAGLSLKFDVSELIKKRQDTTMQMKIAFVLPLVPQR